MMISPDNLLAHLNERTQQIALQCVGTKGKDSHETEFDRGRFAAYKELINYITTNFSDD